MTVGSQRAPYAGWRALAATLLVMAGATSAHTWAGGHLPQWPGLVLMAASVLGGSWLALRHSVSWKLLLPGVVLAQAALHTSFVGAGAHAEHASSMAATATPWSGKMLLAHTFVALLTALVWRLCERAAHVVVRLRALWTPYAGASPDVRLTLHAGGLPRPRAAFLLAAPRRGPPLVTGRA